MSKEVVYLVDTGGNPSISRIILMLAFEVGFTWDGVNGQEVKNTESKYLFFRLKQLVLSHADDYNQLASIEYRLISLYYTIWNTRGTTSVILVVMQYYVYEICNVCFILMQHASVNQPLLIFILLNDPLIQNLA